VTAFVVELLCCGGDLFVDEGVSGEADFRSVNSGVVAWSDFPYYGGRCDFGGGNDDLCGRLALFYCDEDELFELLFLIVLLDESNGVSCVRLRGEVSDCYSGALALVGVLP
jgi:hypothetical protein